MLAPCAMQPRLIGIRGPLNGCTFDLVAAELTLGRSTGNSVVTPDASVSRRHCCIRPAEGAWEVVDNDSRNGTFVNGVAVDVRRLADGDEVRIGHSTLLFIDRPSADESGICLDASRLDTRGAMQVRPAESVYLEPERDLKPSASARHAGLAALVRLASAIRSCRGTEALCLEVLALAAEVIAAGRGAVILLEKHTCEPEATFFWEKGAGEAAAGSAPREIVDRVASEAVAILCRRGSGAAEGAGLAMIAAPVGGARPAGVLLLESTDDRVPFSEDHLQWLAALGSLLAPALEDAREFDRLRGEKRRLETELSIQHDMVGHGPAARRIYDFIARVAPADSSVLITGETGTGKELVARAIHRNSRRASGPFVAINCATLGEALLESELFGHERGAFTGAVALKKGKLELADGGTVFLDEIGELPPALQAKLLRALQERRFERVGGTRAIPVDIRLIAATNRDLQRAISEHAFREDLYFRLNVVALRVPALRERRDDIPALAGHFVERCRERFRPGLKGVAREALDCLRAYAWPGNIRELENAVEHAAVLGDGDWIRPEDLPACILESATPAEPAGRFCEAVNEQKRVMVLKALEETRSYQGAAAQLGIHPNSLHRLIRNLGLRDAARNLV